MVHIVSQLAAHRNGLAVFVKGAPRLTRPTRDGPDSWILPEASARPLRTPLRVHATGIFGSDSFKPNKSERSRRRSILQPAVCEMHENPGIFLEE